MSCLNGIRNIWCVETSNGTFSISGPQEATRIYPLVRLIFSHLWEEKKKITISKRSDKKIHQFPEDLWWHREIWEPPVCAACEIVGREKGNILKSCLVLSSKELLWQHPNPCWAPATRAEWRGWGGPSHVFRSRGFHGLWFLNGKCGSGST